MSKYHRITKMKRHGSQRQFANFINNVKSLGFHDKTFANTLGRNGGLGSNPIEEQVLANYKTLCFQTDAISKDIVLKLYEKRIKSITKSIIPLLTANRT